MPRKNQAIWIESRKRWQINVQHDGERKTFVSSNPKQRGKIEAEQKADRWLVEKSSLDKKRFGSLFTCFLDETRKLASEACYIKYESIGRVWLLPRLRNKRVLAITEQDWQNCINDTQRNGGKKLSAKSCRNIRGVITAFCKYARKQGLPINKPEFIKIPKTAPKGEKKILQPDGLKALFSIDYITHYKKPVPCHYIHAWRFLVLTGLRRGELCGLKNKDIDGTTIYIRRSINAQNVETGGKTNAAQRYFVLPERALAVLAEQKAMLKSKGIISEYVFPDEQARRTEPAHISTKWRTYRDQHNIGCSLHELRHTLISIAQADVPEQLLKRVVGHTQKTDTFAIYGHTVDGEMARAASILDSTFSRLLDDKK